MIRPRQTWICREGWYYLLVLGLVFVPAAWGGVNLLLLLAGLLTGPMLFSLRAVSVTLRGLEVQRRLPEEVCAGDLLVGNLSLRNPRRRLGSWAVVVEERIQREAARGGERPIRLGVLFPYVPARETRCGVYRGRLLRRGRYRLGPLRVSTRFPFGLVGRTITLAGTETLMVFPRLGRLTRRWVRRHQQWFAGTHRRERRAGFEGDFYGVREWRTGDSRRWLHWRTSARAGKLVVRQFEQPRNRNVAVLVDLWQPQRPAAEHLENVELAVSFAATLVADLCRQGAGEVLLATSGSQLQCLEGPASAALLHDALAHLAVAEAESKDSLVELIEHGLREVQAGTEIVLVSTRPVDLSDRSRFESLWADPARHAPLRRVRRIDASSNELAQYFVPE